MRRCWLPSIPALPGQPFWLDPSDRHHIAAVMQAESLPLLHDDTAASGDLAHDTIIDERVWAKAVHSIATENIIPEQAVDEAIARVKQIRSESRGRLGAAVKLDIAPAERPQEVRWVDPNRPQG